MAAPPRRRTTPSRCYAMMTVPSSAHLGGITFDEIIIHEAVKAIMPALPIKSQKVISQ